MNETDRYRLVLAVGYGTASKEEAHDLLLEFVRQAETGAVAPILLDHVRESIRAYLAGQALIEPDPMPVPPRRMRADSLDIAFGLVHRHAGRPRTDPDIRVGIAVEVLQAILAGETPEDAVGGVADRRKQYKLPAANDTAIREAWRDCRVPALFTLAASRRLTLAASLSFEKNLWTPTDMARLREFYGDEPVIIWQAENSENEPL